MGLPLDLLSESASLSGSESVLLSASEWDRSESELLLDSQSLWAMDGVRLICSSLDTYQTHPCKPPDLHWVPSGILDMP